MYTVCRASHASAIRLQTYILNFDIMFITEITKLFEVNNFSSRLTEVICFPSYYSLLE